MTYGCFNRPPMRKSVLVQAGWHWVVLDPRGDGIAIHTRVPNMVTIPNPMTNECQYSLTADDPGCQGCKWNRAQQLNQEPA